jgi:heavy metal sensor kinase
MRFYPRSVRVRLTVWYALALTCIIVIFSAGVYFFVGRSLRAQLDEQVSRDSAVLEGIVTSGEIEEGEDLGEIEQEQLIEYFRLQIPNLPVYETQAWRRSGLNESLGRIGPSTMRSVEGTDGKTFRLVLTMAITDGDTTRIAVAWPEGPMLESLHRMRLILAMGVPAAVLLAVVGGFLLARRALSPIQAMSEKARLITADNLSDRLPVENPDDELGQLGSVFNDMLSRLQDAFDRLRRFTADASHELRTPLTAIRSVGEVSVRKEQDAAGYRDTIGSMLEETDRLARLVEYLLVLTQLEARRPARQEAPTDISALVAEAADCLRVLAEEKDQNLNMDLEPGIVASIDRVSIRQAIISILDNAIKYSPPRSSIFLVTRRSGTQGFSIAIEDEGPGIPPEQRSRIFERFYRMPKDAAGDGGGAGLGLSIARHAVENNGGRIEVSERKSGGSVFKIVL